MRSILLMNPDQPFLGTARLEGLRYEHLDLNAFDPCGTPMNPVSGTLVLSAR